MKQLVADLSESIDPLALTRRVTEQACLQLPNVDGAVVVLCERGRPVVVAAHGVLSHLLGRTAPDELPHPESGRRSELNTPLVRDSRTLGWVAIVSAKHDAFGEGDVKTMAAVGRFISTLLTANTELAHQLDDLLRDTPEGAALDPTACFLASLVAPEAAVRRQLRAELSDIVSPDSLRAVFQPVRDLTDMRVAGFEGLCRFHDGGQAPDQWFAKAHRIGRGVDLELMALRAVLDSARGIPADFDISVNLSPTVAVDPIAQQLIRDSGRRITLELTEHDHATEATYAALDLLRRDGVRLAVDDTGAGFSSLNRILRLRPDVIKLDRELTTSVQSDPARQALATALVYFAREIGAVTVAEGIETEDQHRVLRELGIHFGQGYWLGRPQPAGLAYLDVAVGARQSA